MARSNWAKRWEAAISVTPRKWRLRAWVKGRLRSPILVLHERIDSVRSDLHHDLETLREDVQHSARHLEVRVAAWGVTVVMLVVCGLFFLIGLWLGLRDFIGPVGASFALAGLFAVLAAIHQILLPRELARVDAPRLSAEMADARLVTKSKR